MHARAAATRKGRPECPFCCIILSVHSMAQTTKPFIALKQEMESDRDNDGGGDGVRELFIVDLSDGNNVTESLRLNFLRPYKTLAHFVLIFFSKMA